MLEFWVAIGPGISPATSPRRGANPLVVAFEGRVGNRNCRVEVAPSDPDSARVQVSPESVRIFPSVPHPRTDADDFLELRIDRATGAVEIQIPWTVPIPVYYEQDGEIWSCSNDLRRFWAPGRELDGRGIYSLFQFGAVVSPFSMWKGVRRAAPGKRSTFSADDGRLRESPLPFWNGQHSSGSPDPDSRVDQLVDLLDAQLERTCASERPVILFSGGVDSGLLAARAAAIGWDETLLLNYCRSADDAEADLAHSMARHLGLEITGVTESPEAWVRFLDSVGESFTHPFGGYSTSCHHLLMEQVLAAHSDHRIVLDGAGADSLFASIPKFERWRGLFRVPRPIRSILSSAFRLGHGWNRVDRLGRVLAGSRISRDMSLLVAATAAQTALRGVAFDSSEGVRAEVLESILSSVDEMFPVDAEILRVRGLKLTHPNREMVAVKAVPMTLGRDMEVVFPFLSASLVRFGLEEIVNAPETESKSILKRALARQVPSEMVYRPKTGPAPPFKDQLARPATIERFREQVLHPRNPLYSVIRPTVVSKMIDRAAKGIPLPHMTYTFLSTLLFTSLWIEQVREPSAAEPVSYDRRPTGSPD